MLNYLRSDLKQLSREPIMVLFALLSLVLILVFKGILTYASPVLYNYTGFNLMAYSKYVLVMAYLLHPLMLGTVTGFFMLDEKDGGIFDLLRVTPLGFKGYLINRLLLPCLLTVIYTIFTWIVLGQSHHSLWVLCPILLMALLQTTMVGIYIPQISDDKVKGLTNAKAVSALTLFGFLDLFGNRVISLFGYLTPQYYTALAVNESNSLLLLLGIGVHLCWMLIILKASLNKL